MENERFRLTVLGCRGSMAVFGPDYDRFGGSSSCYLVEAGEQTLFLDAGSGLLAAPAHYERPPAILLSHLHLDHLIGLGMFPGLAQRGLGFRLYVPLCADEDEACRVIDRLYSPPFWPKTLRELEPANRILPLPERFCVGEVLVESIPGRHPDGSVILRLSYGGKRLVYATDYEPDAASFQALCAFAQDAELVLFDAQYTQEEAEHRRGFGHATAEMGLALLAKARVKRLLLIHHDPRSTDETLLFRQRLLPDRVSYARQGETIELV